QPQACDAAEPAEPADDKATGYRLTEHIRKYYRTTWV
ncbi:formate dehydrogenase, partial [Ralstonia solanacearum]